MKNFNLCPLPPPENLSIEEFRSCYGGYHPNDPHGPGEKGIWSCLGDSSPSTGDLVICRPPLENGRPRLRHGEQPEYVCVYLGYNGYREERMTKDGAQWGRIHWHLVFDPVTNSIIYPDSRATFEIICRFKGD